MWKFDLLAIMLTVYVQASFPINLACHCLNEEEDKRSLRSMTMEFYWLSCSIFEEHLFMSKKIISVYYRRSMVLSFSWKKVEEAMSYNIK